MKFLVDKKRIEKISKECMSYQGRGECGAEYYDYFGIELYPNRDAIYEPELDSKTIGFEVILNQKGTHNVTYLKVDKEGVKKLFRVIRGLQETCILKSTGRKAWVV